MKSKLVLLLLLANIAQAFDKDFKTVNDRVPQEFSALFEAMKLEIKTPAEKVRLVGMTQELNQNLGFLPKEHIFLLMKSEVIKNVLEHKFSKVRQFDVTTLLVERLEADFTRKERLLNPFSQWIWRSMLAELKMRQEMGLITNKTFSVRNFQGAKLADAQRFEKYLNYLLPWIDKMDSLSPTDFNQLSKEVSWTILERLNNRSLIFKRYASTAAGDTQLALFNIPSRLTELKPEEIKKMQNNEEESSLSDMSKREKSKAEDEVESATPQDLSPVSEDMNKELEKIIDPAATPAADTDLK